MLFYELSVKETLEKFQTNADTGLSNNEVEKRRKKFGKNELEAKGTPLWRKILEPFMDIFMVMLLVAFVISIIQQAWTEVIMIAIIIAINAIIDYVQQFSTERILRNLRQKTVQPVEVWRNGQKQNVDASELVPGDIVILDEGDRVPADGRIIDESGLLTNEAMLTGESESVAKDANKISGNKKIYEQRNMVFSGSFIVTGQARILVVATGNNTEYGRIASLASSAESVSPIQEKINKLVGRIAIVVVSIAILALIIQLIQGIDFFSSLEFTLAMIVSAVPEGLPIAISVILALGARRMAKKNALIKEMRAIESIGIITTIASDKTGTLTENKLSITCLWPFNKATPDEFLKTVAMSALPEGISTDALDGAIIRHLNSSHHEDLIPDDSNKIDPARSYAFDQTLKMSGNLYAKNFLVVKGAPESILDKCRIGVGSRQQVEAEMLRMTSKGHKVIALASTTLDHEIHELNNLKKDTKFTFLGLISVADTLRPEAKTAISQSLRAGVKVKMITGDHWQTAYEIGKELGLTKDEAEVYDCSKMGNITDDDLADIIKVTRVFARVTPEDKFRILSVMKQDEVVAMTGDGVNDVPALANAHIGIAMGSGPSIVQDAGDIVLLDDNFKNIVDAMKEGRVVLVNIRRMLVYLLSTNAGEAITMIGALLLGGGQLLTPIQILWVNLVTDSLMVVPIGLEPPEQHFMKQKPEPKDAPILNSVLVVRMIIIALTMSAITLGTYFYFNDAHGLTHENANALAFTALVVMQWANAFNIRGIHESVFTRLKTANWKFYATLAIAVILQILTIFTPLGSFVSINETPPILPLVIVSTISFIAPILVVELHKLFINRTLSKRKRIEKKVQA